MIVKFLINAIEVCINCYGRRLRSAGYQRYQPVSNKTGIFTTLQWFFNKKCRGNLKNFSNVISGFFPEGKTPILKFQQKHLVVSFQPSSTRSCWWILILTELLTHDKNMSCIKSSIPRQPWDVTSTRLFRHVSVQHHRSSNMTSLGRRNEDILVPLLPLSCS